MAILVVLITVQMQVIEFGFFYLIVISIYTKEDFFRLMQRMPGKIMPLEFLDSNLPPRPDWANYE